MTKYIDDTMSDNTKKHAARQSIKQTVGDVQTLLGQTSDGAAMALCALGAFYNDVVGGADLKTAVENNPYLPLLGEMVNRVGTGETAFPFSVKGDPLAELEKSATVVTTILATLPPKK